MSMLYNEEKLKAMISEILQRAMNEAAEDIADQCHKIIVERLLRAAEDVKRDVDVQHYVEATRKLSE